MKKIILSFIIFTFISCEQIIENMIDDEDPNYDTFLKIENTSNYQLDNIQITSNSSIYINKLIPYKKTQSFGEYSLLEKPQIRFYINNNLYEHHFGNPQVRIESGNYILKISILSTSIQSFSVELVEDTQ